MTSFVCASHGHCFDGLASAALLSNLVRELEPKTQFTYRALGYGPKPVQVHFKGSQNALLDYRYIPDPALTYYVDHHPTAFANAAEQGHFDQQQERSPDRFIHDPLAPSCARLIDQMAKSKHGHKSARNDEIVAFADKIDSANFSTVDEAIDLASPGLRLVTVVTHFGDHKFYERAIPILQNEGVAGLAAQPWNKRYFEKLSPDISALNQRIKENGRVTGRVVIVNLLDKSTHVVSKFRQYYEFPKVAYSIILMRMHESLRISVGYNPWSGVACDTDIGRICQSFGGGGHAFVGAIGMAEGREQDAVEVARRIALTLQNQPGAS